MRLAAVLFALSLPVLANEGSSAWKLQTSGVVKVKKGAEGMARVEVVPREDAHVSPDAPISLTWTPDAGIKVPKAKLGRADARETAKKGVAFEVPVTAEKSGELKGKLSFFICTDKLCERQTKELAFAVEVQ